MTGNGAGMEEEEFFRLDGLEDCTGDEGRAALMMELRRFGIMDANLLAAMERIPREIFIPSPFSRHAYRDSALPIGCGQTISQPAIVAKMTEALELTDRNRVLEIGTGSGYQTSILSLLCRRVYSIERHKPLLEEAEERFRQLGLRNITAIWGDGVRGWPEQAPFDRVIVTAAAETTPKFLLDQLKEDGGIMVVPVGPVIGQQSLLKITRKDGRFLSEKLMDVRFVPLVPEIARPA